MRGMVGTHVTHCCDQHGCKYGDEDCPVVLKTHPQAYPCETCGLNAEGFFGPDTDGHYDDEMVWHEPASADESGPFPAPYPFTPEFCRDSGLDGI